MDKDQKQMLIMLMAEDFTVIELALYLDTHPDDKKALNDYSDAVRKSAEVRMQYEKKYGPINPTSAAGEYPFRWVDELWPWEINFAL